MVSQTEFPCQSEPNMWFSKSESRTSLAKELCSECWFKDQCLNIAINNQEVHGVWGGVNFSDPSERISSGIKKCRKGHELPPEGGNCYTCRRDSQKRYDKKIKKGSDKRKPKNFLGGYCSNEHLLSEKNTYIRGYDQAVVCKDCISLNRRNKLPHVKAYYKSGDLS